MRTESVDLRAPVALVALLAALGTGCVLAPRAARDERLRATRAGDAWRAPADERVVPDLPPEPGWRDLLARAFLANGELEAAWADWRAALDRIDIAAGWPNTNVAVGYEYLFSSENLKAWDRTTLSVGFDPMQNLSFPTKALAAGRVTFAEAQAAGARFEQMKFDLQRRVLAAWHAYALLGERLRIQRATVDLLRLRAASATGRVTAGAPQAELLIAEVDVGLAEDERRRLEAELPQQRARLNALLGRAADAPLVPPAALAPPRPLPADDARLLAVATDANPELRSLAHEVQGRRDAIDRARQEFIPDVNPFASFAGSLEQAAGIVASLPARIPIILGMIREARAKLQRAEATRRQVALDRGADFVATLVALRDLERQASFVEGTLLPLAEGAAAGTRASYETGGLDAGALVESERAVLELRLLRAETLTARETRLAELEALAGVDVETLATGGAAS